MNGRSRIAVCIGAMLGLALAGCSGKNENLSEVTGTVTLDGQALPDAVVVFSPVSGGTTSYGRTDSAGNFRMLFRDNEYGAWLGENIVRITTFDLPANGKPGKKELVPNVYNTKSKTKVVVAAGPNTHNFELKSSAGKVVQGQSE